MESTKFYTPVVLEFLPYHSMFKHDTVNENVCNLLWLKGERHEAPIIGPKS